MADLVADPVMINELRSFFEIKALALTGFADSQDQKVEHLRLQAHLHPADPSDILPLVKALQPELLDLAQVPHDHGHRAVVLVESLAPL